MKICIGEDSMMKKVVFLAIIAASTAQANPPCKVFHPNSSVCYESLQENEADFTLVNPQLFGETFGSQGDQRTTAHILARRKAAKLLCNELNADLVRFRSARVYLESYFGQESRVVKLKSFDEEERDILRGGLPFIDPRSVLITVTCSQRGTN
jgi:hypothetical protein